jgi:type VI secretion system secreted protein Hcp
LVAENWFLKIDGIVGESNDNAHKGEIDVQSWTWGVSNPGDVGSGSGGGAGKPTFEDFHFVARISKASPKLFLSCATGTHHKLATLSGVRAGGQGKAPFLSIKLTDVLVTGYRQSGGESEPATEQFSFNYGKFDIGYVQQTGTGKLGPSVTAGYDLTLGKKV